MRRAIAIVAGLAAVGAGCGPSLWSVGGAPPGAAPRAGERAGTSRAAGGVSTSDYGAGGDATTGDVDLLALYQLTTRPGADTSPSVAASTAPAAIRAAELSDAADLLRQAEAARAAGKTSTAELLFSSAELLVGAPMLANLADGFRAGAPPRVTDAPITVADTGRQAAVVGSSDDEDAAAPPRPDPAEASAPPPVGRLDGTLTLAGAPPGEARAFITLDPTDRRGRARVPRQRVMEQRDRQFAPRLMLIPVGSTVSFPNFDPIFHNVFSTSSADAFDLGLYRQGEARSVTFAKEGIVRIGCSIHANMAATIVVIDAPHYVIPGGDGGFRFRSLAPGKYKLRAWSERSRTPITQEITIAVGDNTVDVGVDGDAPTGPLDDKFGVKRGGR
jgi:plastocyanin